MSVRACTSATYPSRAEAVFAKKRNRRSYHLAINVRHCEQCDQYHLKLDEKKLKIPKRCIEIVNYLALGYTFVEIAKITGIPYPTTKYYFKEIKFALSALSVPHLIAILISLGQLDPRDYVPELTERCDLSHERSENDQRRAMQRNSSPRILQSA